MRWWKLTLLFGSLIGGALPAADAPPATDPVKEALQTGATVAQIFLSYLEPNATPDFPGTAAWVKGTGATLAGLDKDHPSEAWRGLDPDLLITRNPAWWQSYYEVAPADPGMALLHAGALLCAGDAQRAIIVLRLALNYKNLDPDSARIIASVIQHAGAYMEPSHQLVREGLVLHDNGDYEGAIAKYDAALKMWPRNGWALFEKGLSIRMHEKTPGDHPPVVSALFARSRTLDPFQWNAWQGQVKEIPGLMEMQQKARPLWDKCLARLNFQMSEKELTELGDALQLAQVDDLALIVRQLLVQHRGRYALEDHGFIAKSLRRLVPGDRTEVTINKLGGDTFKAIRLYDAKGKTAEK